MKVLVLNTVVLNTGDAAILQGVLEVLRDGFGQNVRTVVFDSHADAAPTYYPGIEFRRPPYQIVTGWAPFPRRSIVSRARRRSTRAVNVARFRAGLGLWRRGGAKLAAWLLTRAELELIEDFSRADLIVSTGGTYLIENYALDPKLFDLALAVDVGRALVLFTQSLGPFRDPEHRDAIRRIALASRVVLLRDPLSQQHLRDLGVPTAKLLVAADAAFAMARAPRRTSRAGRDPSAGLRVAISVRAWTWFERRTADDGMSRFKSALAEVTRRLIVDRGAYVTYVSTCQGAPEYQMDDSKTAAEIVAALPAGIRSRVILDTDFHTPQTLEAMLGEFDLAIATRMHFAILAMMAGTATVPIAYEFKTTELFAAMKLGHLVENIETVTAASLLDKVDWVLSHRGEVETAIVEAVDTERERALGVAAILRDCHDGSLRVTTAT